MATPIRVSCTAATETLDAIQCDLLAVGVREDALSATIAPLTSALGEGLGAAVEGDEFTGKAGSSICYPTFGRMKAGRVLLVGLGQGTVDEVRRAAGMAGNVARTRGLATVALTFGALDAAATRASIEGFGAGNYRFDRYKPEAERKVTASELRFIGDVDLGAARAAQAVLSGQSLARDLVNETPGKLYPETLAEAARALQDAQLRVEVWDESRISEEGMGGIEAVGQGSVRPARFVHMTWTPPGTPRARIALVGKGVTFDSGGLSLKPSASMQTMRCDMGGAAAVIGAMSAIRAIEPDVEVHGIFGAVENMLGPNSYKLGDVLRMYSGKTVEIHNTDAEGRLVLADCLHYASRLKPDAIVDLATLTGAAVVALGESYTALFSADDTLASTLLTHAADAGESFWRMPLPDHYREKLKADWGEIKNVGGREGGAITAALFLSEFVAGAPWAHLDIAGPAFLEKPWRHLVSGGTGAGVATLARWVEALGADVKGH